VIFRLTATSARKMVTRSTTNEGQIIEETRITRPRVSAFNRRCTRAIFAPGINSDLSPTGSVLYGGALHARPFYNPPSALACRRNEQITIIAIVNVMLRGRFFLLSTRQLAGALFTMAEGKRRSRASHSDRISTVPHLRKVSSRPAITDSTRIGRQPRIRELCK